jgi:hypothetical protein
VSDDTAPAPAPQSGAGPAQSPQAPQIDIKALAEKVYRLMLADLRLTQARAGQPTRPKKR